MCSCSMQSMLTVKSARLQLNVSVKSTTTLCNSFCYNSFRCLLVVLSFNSYEMVELIRCEVQVLKYEPHHYSALAQFLLERACNNEIGIGIPFFWHLQVDFFSLLHQSLSFFSCGCVLFSRTLNRNDILSVICCE
jgi:hypothetical protein